MKCRQVVKVMNTFVEGKLSLTYKKKVEEHVVACSHCRAKLIELHTMHALLVFSEDVKAPENFTFNVMKQIKKLKESEKGKQQASIYKTWGISFVAAAVFMLFLNISGITENLHYATVFNKTAALQRAIMVSVDEMSKTILQIFDRINIK